MDGAMPLAEALERATNVFGLASSLGYDFRQEHREANGFYGAGGESVCQRHSEKLAEFTKAVQETRLAITKPPAGCETVAIWLRKAAELARGLPQLHDWDLLDQWPDLNQIGSEGYQAVKQVRTTLKLDDPFAFLDEPQAGPLAGEKNLSPSLPTGTMGWLLEQMAAVEAYQGQAAQQRAKITGPLLEGSKDSYYNQTAMDHGRDADRVRQVIADTEGVDRLRAYCDSLGGQWGLSWLRTQRGRLSETLDIEPTEVDGMTVVEFRQQLRELDGGGQPEPTASATASDTTGTGILADGSGKEPFATIKNLIDAWATYNIDTGGATPILLATMSTQGERWVLQDAPFGGEALSLGCNSIPNILANGKSTKAWLHLGLTWKSGEKATAQRWLELARQSGVSLPDLSPEVQVEYANDPACIWATYVAHCLWDSGYRMATEHKQVYYFSASAAALQAARDLCPKNPAVGGAGHSPEVEKVIEKLERETPPLDTKSVEWVASSEKNREKLGLPTETLRTYRLESVGGRKMPDEMFGIDRDGRIWRRRGTPKSQVYYYKPSLIKASKKASN